MNISFEAIRNCGLCPRLCGVNRFQDQAGYCQTDYQYRISSIVNHTGEEPPISGRNGICNIFFGHCNLQCVFCQNHQISSNTEKIHAWSLEKILSIIIPHLENGCRSIGFVTPSHQIPQMVSIIKALENYPTKPVFVFNSNGYDHVEVLQRLEGMIDIYLPDFKYNLHDSTSLKYSGANNYVEVSRKAIKEMFRQKGSSLRYTDNNYAEFGLIIRHLVIPGEIENSMAVLDWIAEELSEKVHVSLMSQYYPTHQALQFQHINRPLSLKEYDTIARHMENLGFTNGWIQELVSNNNYRPNFNKEHPFEIN